MGLLRQQQERLAVRYLTWKLKQMHAPLPDRATLAKEAKRIVEDAHRIARQRGTNVVAILKELVSGWKGDT